MAALDFSDKATPVGGEGALDFSDQSVEAREKRPSVMDVAKAALIGYVPDTARMIGYGLERAGVDYGTRMRTAAGDTERDITESMTPGGRRAFGENVFEGEGLSDLHLGDHPLQALVMGAARSAPQMAEMIPLGAPVAAGVSRIPAIARAAGALEGVPAATGVKGLIARNAPGALGFGGAEGVQAGAQNAEQTETQIEGTPFKKLYEGSPKFRALVDSGVPESDARTQLAREAAADVFRRTVPSTGGIGVLTGGGAAGELVKRGSKNFLKGIFKGAGEETLQEGLQSGPEQYIQNVAERDYADETKDPWSQVASQALTGAAIGGATGGALGGAAHVATHGTKTFDNDTGEEVVEGGPSIMDRLRSVMKPYAEPVAAPAATVTPKAEAAVQRMDKAAQDALQAPSKVADPLARIGTLEADTARLKAAGAPEAEVVAAEKAVADAKAELPAFDYGKPTTFSTESNAKLSGRYAIADLADLTASHTAELKENPDFPQALQPRDRSAAGYEVQVSKIASQLNPERLGESPDVATGAPIVGADGIVESGNGRAIAIQRAYDEGGEPAKAYRAWLEANAEKFGLTPEAVKAKKNPVLVRVRETPVNRAEFARQANAPTTAQMAPLDVAKSDAARMGSIEGLHADDNGNFMVPANDGIIRGFFSALPITEQTGMVDRNGRISQAGYRRFQNALLVKAYGDASPTLVRMVESLDDTLRGISSALVKAAPALARAREAIKAGAMADRDITADVVRAVDEVARLRAEKRSVGELLAQSGMFEALSPAQVSLITFIDGNVRSPNRIAEFIQSYLGALGRYGQPGQNEMFGGNEAPPVAAIVGATLKEIGHETAGQGAQAIPTGAQPRGGAAAEAGGGAAGSREEQGAGALGAAAENAGRPGVPGDGARGAGGVDGAVENVVARAEQLADDLAGAKHALDFKGAFKGVGGAISQNFYAQIFTALKAGHDAVAGVRDPVLVRAEKAYKAGLIKTAADVRRFEENGYPVDKGETSGNDKSAVPAAGDQAAVEKPAGEGEAAAPAASAEEKALTENEGAAGEHGRAKPRIEGTVEEGAHAAASSPQNSVQAPTKAQIEAGNAKLGHIKVAGMDISIENPAGSVREDVSTEPPKWRVTMRDHYGYFRGTVGFDKDHLDAFAKVGTPEDWQGTIFVVNQNNAEGGFDEHKVMLGFANEADAREGYLSNYDDRAQAEKRIRSIVALPLEAFKAWAYDKTKAGPKGGELPASRAGAMSIEPEPVDQGGSSPTKAPNERWTSDRGAIPGEPMLLLDMQNGDADTAKAAITEREVPGKGVLYDATDAQGNLLGTAQSADEAAAIAEKAFPIAPKKRVAQASRGAEPKIATTNGTAYTETPEGPVLVGREVAIVQPSSMQAQGAVLHEHTILDRDGNKDVGRVALVWRDGKVAGLVNIQVLSRERGRGLGEAVLRTLLEHNGEVPINIGFVAPSAREFWRKMGVDLYETDWGEDGTATLEAYRAARRGDERAGEAAPRAAAGAEAGNALASRPDAGRDSGRGLSRDEVVGRLTEAFGPGVERLFKSGLFNFAADKAGLPDRLQVRYRSGDEAWYDPAANSGRGAIWFIGSELSSERVVPVTLHELGEHHGLPEMLGDKGYANLLESVRALKDSNAVVRRAWAHVLRNYTGPKSTVKEGDDTFVAEVIARVGESTEALQLPFFKRLMAAIREFLVRLGLSRGAVRDLTDKDLVQLVTSSARRAIAGVEPRGFPVPAPATASSPVAPVFFSALYEKAAELKRASGTAAEWKKEITALPGVKKEELEWSGINDWLETQKGKVTKAQVIGYLGNNGVQVEETVLGSDTQEEARATSERDSLVVELDSLGYSIDTVPETHTNEMVLDAITDRKSGYTYHVDGGGIDEAVAHIRPENLPGGREPAETAPALPERVRDIVDRLRELEFEMPTKEGSSAKFGQYTLPGGENYRELLLTLPDAKMPLDIRNIGDGKWGLFVDGKQVGSPYPSEDAARIAASTDQQTINRLGPARNAKNFRSSHFDQPNILAHVRFNERTDADGKKVLFIEEVQSDWAQAGKRRGFASKPKSDSETLRLLDEAGYKAENNGVNWVVTSKDGSPVPNGLTGMKSDESQFAGSLQQVAAMVLGRKDLYSGFGLPPQAPFVGKTEAWVSLALKRMIRWAAENGFDRVAWTNGEQQVDRYDLSKHISEMNVRREKDGRYSIGAFTTNGPVDLAVNEPEERLADIVGKDLADKIKSNTKKEQNYKGLDLRIGGEGMRTFYDKILPNIANDVLKKLGGGRVNESSIKIPVNDAAEAKFGEWKPNAPDHMSQPGFDVTPAMRETALQGLPMFSKGGQAALADRVDEIVRGKTGDLPLYFGETPVVLQRLGMKPLPTAMEPSKAEKAVFDHAVFAREMKALAEAIADPVMVMNSESKLASPDALVVVTDLVKSDGRPIIVSIEPNRTMKRVPVNELTSAYPREKHLTIIPQWVRRNLRYVNNEKRSEWQRFTGLQLPEKMPTRSVQGQIVLSDRDIVKTERAAVWGDDPFQKAPKASRGGAATDIFGSGEEEAPKLNLYRLKGRDALADRVRDALGAMFDSDRTFNWWHRSVGTQYHKATVSAPFRKAFVEGQAFLTDTNRFSMQAEEKAPELLLRIEGLKDILKRPPAKEDVEAAATALFEGTLAGGSDPTQGKVWTAEELKARGMTEKQIRLYGQTRAAIDESIETMAKSTIARLVRSYGIDLERDMTIDDIAAVAKEKLTEHAADVELKRDQVTDTGNASVEQRFRLSQEADAARQAAEQVEKIRDRTRALQAAGYMPLMRFGQHWVNVTQRDGEGHKEIYFGMYESQGEANRAAQALRAEFPQAEVTKGLMNPDAHRIFKGISPDTIELFADVAGLAEHPLMQKYIQLAVSERSAMKRMLERKGTPGFSWDLSRVLAQFIASNARAASGNYHHAKMLEAITDIPKDQGDVASEATRMWEYLTDPKEEATAFRGYLFFHFLGGSVASAMVNMTQPVLMTGPWLAQHASPAKASGELGRAMLEAAREKAPTDAAGQAMQRAIEEGVVAPHEIYQLMAEARGGIGRNVALRRLTRVWGGLFSLAEAWNRKTTFLAAYRIAEAKGEADPYEFAARAVNETQGLYNRGNRPNWARGTIGASLFTFKQFSVSYLEFLKRLPAPQQALALGMLVLAAGIQGLPFADDIDDLADTFGQWMGYATNSKQWKRKVLEQAFGQFGTDFVLHGLSAIPAMPLDVQARLGLGNLIPGTSLLKPSSAKQKAQEIAEVFGPAGGLAQSTGQVAEALFQGDVGQAAKAGLPTSLKNAYQAYEMFQTGEYRDMGGRKVLDVGAQESFVKLVGFNPSVVARDSRRTQEVRTNIDLQKATESSIAEAWASSIVNKDQSGIDAARAKLKDWNAKNPELPVVITRQQLMRRVQEARKTRDERVVKSAPKEIRRSVAEDLRQ